MADNLTDTAENLVLTWLFTGSAATRPTTPWTIALITSAGPGSDSSLGTEVTAGGNSYARQAVTFGTAASGLIENTNAPTWTNMPAVTVGGIAIFENGGTRIAYGTLAANKTTNAGDTFTIAIGDIDITLG
jgi:hypothetical protein